MDVTRPVFDRLRAAAYLALGDAEFSAACRGLPGGIGLEVTGVGDTISIALRDGNLETGVRLVAPEQSWAEIAQPVPAPGWHSFAAASRRPEFTVVATDLARAQSFHALERYFEILRGQVQQDATDAVELTAISGAYARIGLSSGQTTTLFHERSGRADQPALVMLHTAGADSRQFHALMADEGLRSQWSMHAFDMPGHGRSAPIADEGWAGYQLRMSRYSEICITFIRQVLKRPVVLIGCSMGAAICLHLARESKEWVRGAIALEAPMRSPGRRNSALCHAQVNQAAHNPSYVRGLLAPQSPLACRRQAAWIYSQGGFGIYDGDLTFYSDEFDAARDVAGLDGRKIPVELLTGSYDHSATPTDSRAVAAMIPGSRFTEMPELGHFPMTENPKALMVHLVPALQRVRASLILER